MKKIFSSESVGRGHPDKMCDQISDSILTECLIIDKNARVAIECLFSNDLLVIAGEVSMVGDVDYENIARKVISEIGYDKNYIGVNSENVKIIVNINKQSQDISIGVDKDNSKLGAGDQGLMFGYADDITENLMPLAIDIANRIIIKADELRTNGSFKWALPDMKCQVSINEETNKVDSVLFSCQHLSTYDFIKFKNYITDEIIVPVVCEYETNPKFEVLVNPTGNFVIGGSVGDTGLTGRKIIVDSYGGSAKHGGGAFSGKDYTKVDRSAAYYCRYVAKNIVASRICRKFEIQVAYAIGVSNPVSITYKTFGTNACSDKTIDNILKYCFDFSVDNIVNELDLKNVDYSVCAFGGHFGRDYVKKNEKGLKCFTWENTNKVRRIIDFVNYGGQN